MKAQAPYTIFNNTRFYILLFSLLVSFIVFAYLRLTIESDQLLLIRTQQMYGALCLVFLYIALIISPAGQFFDKDRLALVNFSRRAIGVSACYFGALHAGIAFFGQLGGLSQMAYLPDTFIWSLSFGAIALFILLVLAGTSFDKVISWMGFEKWKLLHRLVYIAGVLVVVHVWMVGTHLAYSWSQLIGLSALSVLFGLEALRFTRYISAQRLHLGKAELLAVAVSLWVLMVVLVLAMPTLLQNYHSRHTTHSHGQEGQ